jgi:hypothetical protein
MIQSQYILDILDLAFDGYRSGDLLRSQVPFLTLTEVEHTGIGAFFQFKSDSAIEKFRIDTSDAKSFDIDGNPIDMLDGIEIRNPELSILADAIVHLKNGLIDHLEIWNKGGEAYVKINPEHYELYQIWLGNVKKRSIIR